MRLSQKRKLRESFFNPILQVLPLIVFLIIDHISTREFAWYGAIITAIAVTVYVAIAFRRLFKWHLFFVLSLLGVAALMSIVAMTFNIERFNPLLDEFVFLLFVLAVRVFRKQVVSIAGKLVSPFVPMTNNLVEIYKYVNISIIIVSSYIVFYIVFSYFLHAQYYIITVLDYVFALAWIVLIVFSYLKVRFVYYHLADERWLPIVTKKGEVLEQVQRLSSLSDGRRYTHPVVRGILIKEGRILVKKSAEKDMFYKPQWDNMIDNHISIGEKDVNCLKKTALKSFGIEIKKSYCLTEYIHTTPYEHQYEIVFLILDYSGEIIPNPRKIAQMKWMSVEEIERELESGVFDERFVKEYALLKRAGLLT